MSLQEPVYSDGGDTLYVMDQLSDKKNKEETWVEELSLEAAMNCLGERERSIIQMRFFEGRTQMEIAKDIRISQAQVSRLEKNALKTMAAISDIGNPFGNLCQNLSGDPKKILSIFFLICS